uniref:Uncharacterized protein n=1 Tax=Caenorhabditis japonica TaxID=281687 RepID=A0A8R1E0G2_CAEJA
MRYPPIADIDSFVKLARHYRNPKKNAKPTIKSNNYEQITVAGSCHPNKIQRPAKSQQTPASNKKKQDLEKEATSSILALSPVIHRVKNSIRDESNKISKTSSPRKPPEKPQPTTKTDNWAYEIQMMEMQVSTLQTRLNEQDILCSQVSKALEIYSEDVRNAKSSEQCAKLAQNLLELSKTLVSTKPQPNSQKTGTKSEPNVTKALIKPSETTPIRQVNEMVDISAKRLQH